MVTERIPLAITASGKIRLVGTFGAMPFYLLAAKLAAGSAWENPAAQLPRLVVWPVLMIAMQSSSCCEEFRFMMPLNLIRIRKATDGVDQSAKPQ